VYQNPYWDSDNVRSPLSRYRPLRRRPLRLASCGEKEAIVRSQPKGGVGLMATFYAILDLMAKVLSIGASGLTIYILISHKRSK